MLQPEFTEVVRLIKQSQLNALKAVNAELVNLYWNIGGYISHRISLSQWGEKTVTELADFIQKNDPSLKGFDRRGLYRMKQFYETYKNLTIVSSLMTQLQPYDIENDTVMTEVGTQFKWDDIRETVLANISWTHHLTLLARTQTDKERLFYIDLAVKERYSVRELDRQISSGIFERSMIGSHQISNTTKGIHPDISANFKNNYVFEFLNLPEPYSEEDLQRGLICQMKQFILELGKDFVFIGQEYRVPVGNSDFYIDLLFYHRALQCLVAFDLKADKFKPEHIGKLNFYLEALDRDVKKENENPSIGILLCKDKDQEVVKYALNRSMSPTMVSEYQMRLPDKKLLEQKLHELFENEAKR